MTSYSGLDIFRILPFMSILPHFPSPNFSKQFRIIFWQCQPMYESLAFGLQLTVCPSVLKKLIWLLVSIAFPLSICIQRK
jgi:hypothetical protein